MAVDEGASVVAHTYTEPTVYFEYALDIAREARRRGRKNVLVTNGYIELEPLHDLCQVVDAANVDLKSFSDRTYQAVCKGRLAPVLRTIETMVSNGVWVEVTTLLIPGLNDNDKELRKLAGFLVALDAGIPWHVSRFHPDYRMLDRPGTPPESLRQAMDIGREAGLHFVYGGNMGPGPHESTRCPSCGTSLVQRQGFQVIRCSVTAGCCPSCETPIPGRWL
jgi:pyruvate formate lyase activating enzyme